MVETVDIVSVILSVCTTTDLFTYVSDFPCMLVVKGLSTSGCAALRRTIPINVR